jgi:hypothetical protein
MTDDPYPYDQPPWRRCQQATSPDGQWRAGIDEATELFMSGPTKGKLFIPGLVEIPDCSPVFIWSDDSRFIAVPQWKYFLRRRQRLLIVDTHTKTIYASPSQYRLLVPEMFSGGVVSGVDSPIRAPRPVAVRVSDARQSYKRMELPAVGKR